MSANTRKFGIEIECFIPEQYHADFNPGSYHHGNPIVDSASDGWNSQHDGSIHTTRHNYFAAEIVSPILSGENGLAEIWYMCDYLNDVNAKVNGSTGLHIHVDATFLSTIQVQRIINAFVKFESAFFGMCGQTMVSRMRSDYCRPSHYWGNVIQPLHSRYCALNATNIGRRNKNTLEFRCFSSTTNPEIILSTVYMAVGLVEYAKDEAQFDIPQIKIQNPVDAAKELCKIFRNRNHRIISDESAADITRTIKAQCRKAQREIERAGTQIRNNPWSSTMPA